MTYDDWKTRSDRDEEWLHGIRPDEDDPREVPEPDWDEIRESRRESREATDEADRQRASEERELQRIELGYAIADLIDAGDMDQEF